MLSRGKWHTVEVLACPVTWQPHPEQIAFARRGYEDCWRALDWVRDGLAVCGILGEMDGIAAMPKVRPLLLMPTQSQNKYSLFVSLRVPQTYVNLCSGFWTQES